MPTRAGDQACLLPQTFSTSMARSSKSLSCVYTAAAVGPCGRRDPGVLDLRALPGLARARDQLGEAPPRRARRWAARRTSTGPLAGSPGAWRERPLRPAMWTPRASSAIVTTDTAASSGSRSTANGRSPSPAMNTDVSRMPLTARRSCPAAPPRAPRAAPRRPAMSPSCTTLSRGTHVRSRGQWERARRQGDGRRSRATARQPRPAGAPQRCGCAARGPRHRRPTCAGP